MKINKVVFSCSEPRDYSSFWNIQSEIYAKSLGIEPVCLLYGKRSNTDMHETYGQVIEMETIPDLPWSLQMTWSKFNHPLTDPSAVWLIGDIDLVPLQKSHFTVKIAGIADDGYAHLNPSGISQPRLGCYDGFIQQGSERHLKDRGIVGGADLPGHYHCAKGKWFELYTQGRSFPDQIRHIMDSGRYGMGVMTNRPLDEAKSNPYWYYWCAEENYTSEILWNAIKSGQVTFHPVAYNNNPGTDRLGRDRYNKDSGEYSYQADRVASGQIVDVHCARPYESQRVCLENMVKLSGIL